MGIRFYVLNISLIIVFSPFFGEKNKLFSSIYHEGEPKILDFFSNT